MTIIEKITYKFIMLFMICIPLFKFVSYALYLNGIIENSYNFNHVYVLWMSLPIFIILYIINLFYKKITYVDIIIYILIILALISTAFAQDVNISIFGENNRNEGLLTLLNYYFLFLNVKSIKEKQYKEKIINIFIILGIFQVIYSILQVYTDFSFIKHFSKDHMAMGLCGNPNFLGSYMVMLVLITSTLYLLDNKKIYLLLTCFFALGLYLANSTGPFIGFFLAFIFLVIFKFKKIKLFNLFHLVILFTLIFFVNDYLVNKKYTEVSNDYRRYNIKYDIVDTTINIKENNKEYNYGSSRFKLWNNLIPIAKKYYLFGCGLDNLRVVYPQDKGLIYDKAHNVYYQILITNGIFALISYCLLCLIIFIKGFKLNNTFLLSLYISFIGYCIQAFGNISVIDVAPYFFIILGLLYSKDDEIVI